MLSYYLGLDIMRFLSRHAGNFLAYGTGDWYEDDQYALMVEEGLRTTTTSIILVENDVGDLRHVFACQLSRSLDRARCLVPRSEDHEGENWGPMVSSSSSWVWFRWLTTSRSRRIIGRPASGSQFRTELEAFYGRSFQELRILVSDPEEAVVYGAALQARTLAPQERDDWYTPVTIMMRPVGTLVPPFLYTS